MRPTGRAQESIRKVCGQRNGSHKKLVKEVTEHLRFFPHGMMEAVLEEVFNRLSSILPKATESPWTASEHSVSPEMRRSRFGGFVLQEKHQGRAHRVTPCRKLKETFADMEYKMNPRSFNVMELILFIYLKQSV